MKKQTVYHVTVIKIFSPDPLLAKNSSRNIVRMINDLIVGKELQKLDMAINENQIDNFKNGHIIAVTVDQIDDGMNLIQ
jgi:hypothetical protein